MESSILPDVRKHFNQLKLSTIQAEDFRPLRHELRLINTAYLTLKVLPQERLLNHYDHFKFESEEDGVTVYLTVRDIFYKDAWKLTLSKKLYGQNSTITKASLKNSEGEHYPTSFIEKNEIFDGKKTVKTTPEDYLLKSEYDGYCRTDFRKRTYD